jgi:hypothetical protein
MLSPSGLFQRKIPIMMETLHDITTTNNSAAFHYCEQHFEQTPHIFLACTLKAIRNAFSGLLLQVFSFDESFQLGDRFPSLFQTPLDTNWRRIPFIALLHNDPKLLVQAQKGGSQTFILTFRLTVYQVHRPNFDTTSVFRLILSLHGTALNTGDCTIIVVR